ncbi:MAG: TonB-dependent receptor plug domain-containing protein [Bacteroidales bacterium]
MSKLPFPVYVKKNPAWLQAFIFIPLQYCLLIGQQAFCQHPENVQPLLLKKVTLDEVIISANKVEESFNKVSQSLQTIRLKTIREIAAPTTADLLTHSMGIFVQKSQQGGGSPNIRGFESNRILLVVDGVRQNNLIFRGGHLQNIITIDPSILERIDVVFGPSSTVYGSDALGGTIHMITRDPALAGDHQDRVLHSNAFFRYATANQGYTAHADFNISNKKAGSFSSITFNKFGDLRMGKNINPFYDERYWERPYYMERIGTKDSMMVNSDPLLQKFSGYRQVDLLQKFIFKPSERIKHRINLQFSTSTDIPRYDRLTESSSNMLKYAEWYYGPQLRFLSAYDLIIKNILGFNQLQTGLSYQYLEESRNSRKTGVNYLTHRHEFVSVAAGYLNLLKTIKNHEIRIGTEFQLNTLQSAACDENILDGTNKSVSSRYPDGNNRMNFIDLYISHRWDIRENVSFNQGLRAGYNKLFASFKNMDLFPYPFREMEQKTPTVSGSLGLVYLPRPDMKLTGNVSTGYRVPNIDDLAKIFERPANTIVVPNPDVKPEKSVNADIGFSKTWGSGLRWETSIFATLFNDIIVVGPGTYLGQDSILFEGTLCRVLSGQNKTHAHVYGFSSNLSGNICPSFTLDAGIYYNYGRIQEEEGEKPMSAIPPLTGRIGTGYQRNALSSNFFILFNGWKPLKDYYLNSEDNEQYATPKGMPAWFTLNFRIDYKFNKYLSAQFGIDNILDTQYRVFASGINAPGRNFLATLKVSL